MVTCPTRFSKSVCLVELVTVKHFMSRMSLASPCTCQDLAAFRICPLTLRLYGIKCLWQTDFFSLTLVHPRHAPASTGDVTHTEIMLKVKANLREDNPTGLVDNRKAISGSVPVL